MRNLDRFNEAFAHMGHKVMGRKLKKFTLRHRFWLDAMGSPITCGGKVGLVDLELASIVCSLSGRELDSKLPAILARGPSFWAKWVWVIRSIIRVPDVEYALFQAYLIDHGCPPATWGEDREVVGNGDVQDQAPLPPLLNLVTGLIRGSGWDPVVAWSLSPGEAEWYLAGIFTHRGCDVGLKTPADEAMEEHLRKRREAAEQAEKESPKDEGSAD